MGGILVFGPGVAVVGCTRGVTFVIIIWSSISVVVVLSLNITEIVMLHGWVVLWTKELSSCTFTADSFLHLIIASHFTGGSDGAVRQNRVILPTPGVGPASCMYLVATDKHMN